VEWEIYFRRQDVKLLTPTKAVKDHCKYFCMNNNRLDCGTKECVLKLKMSALKKIRAYCKECAPDLNPQECDGLILNTPEISDYGKCPLWIYRFGKNPHLKHNRNPKHLKSYQFARIK
jgi:hypothetical protein